MNNLTIGQEVVATISQVRYGKEDMVFTSTVMDIAKDGVWVDHPELQGEDMLYIDLTVNGNSVEAVTTVKREVVKETEMKEAKKTIQKAIRWEDDDVVVSVKIYDVFEDNSNWEQFDDQQSYDVEIQWAIGEDVYTDCVVTDSFYSNVEGDEVALKEATKRAKAVLRTVKGWFAMNDQVTVIDTVEVYHA
jgi:RNA binding exosome subunit